MDEFRKEIENYSIDDLNLILSSQKELYTKEEFGEIQALYDSLIGKERKTRYAEIFADLPSEIVCQKCDGINPFENDTCIFCGYKIDKTAYHKPKDAYEEAAYELGKGETAKREDGFAFQYAISFFVPLIGYILGALLLSKESPSDKKHGKECIIIAVISSIICSVILFAIYF